MEAPDSAPAGDGEGTPVEDVGSGEGDVQPSGAPETPAEGSPGEAPPEATDGEPQAADPDEPLGETSGQAPDGPGDGDAGETAATGV
jgi:hypothetical protein